MLLNAKKLFYLSRPSLVFWGSSCILGTEKQDQQLNHISPFSNIRKKIASTKKFCVLKYLKFFFSVSLLSSDGVLMQLSSLRLLSCNFFFSCQLFFLSLCSRIIFRHFYVLLLRCILFHFIVLYSFEYGALLEKKSWKIMNF